MFQTISSVQVDEVVDAINDTFNKIVRPVQMNILILNCQAGAFRMPDPAEKKAKMAEVLGTAVPLDFLR